MRRATWIRVGLFVLLPAFAASCGGGGGYGGGGGGGGPSRLVFSIPLAGASESPVIDADATGTAVLDLKSDGTLSFAVTGQPSWAGGVTGLEIRQGYAGENGPLSTDLLLGGATFDVATSTAEDVIAISRTLAGNILSLPGYYYVQVKTSAAPAGLVRGQFAVAVPQEIHAVLLGSQETTVASASARGAATFAVGASLSVHYVLAMASPAVGSITQGQVRVGSAGTDGPILVDLNTAAATLDAVAGTITGNRTIPVAALCRMRQDLPAFYVDVRTVAAPAGVARGQTEDGPEGVWSTLSGAAELVVVDAAARGGLTLDLQSFTSGLAVHSVPPAQGIAGVTAAEVHLGIAGTTGAAVLDLRAGAGFAIDAAAGMGEGPVTLDQALYARLLGNPAGFYVNLVTAAAPGGLVRGPLTQNPATFRALMLGTLQTVIVDPSASGAMRFLVTDIHAASFDITMTLPSAASLINGHAHEGAAGVNGSIVVDLLGGTNVVVAGNVISGNATFTGRTFAGLLAAPELYYGNVHTLLAPAGVARGQFFRVTDSSPPTGLVYSTPVVYTTAGAIVPNVPSSGGGAVSSYAILPALPAGLSIHPTTGIISGTPTVTSASTLYTVTASNTAGPTTAPVNITVNVAPPTSLAYTTPVAYVVSSAITNNVPSSTGGAIASYGVVPALPAGLSLNTSTGVISGTPTAVSSAADHVVTGTNLSGFVTATVNVKVDATLAAPSGLSYTTPVTYTTGTAITANTPTIAGGAVASWGVSPALPAGLSFSTSTGVISGTPTTVTSAANYTVTATNATGFTTAIVNITVNLGAPTSLTYTNTPNLAYLSPAYFTTMSPSSSGGAVASYSIDITLPAGIALDTSTGTISGIPTATSVQTTYTVTATNATGSTTATIKIEVR